MVRSGLVFRGNTFRAVVNARDPTLGGARPSTAWGLTFSAVPVDTGLTFVDNTFASNDVSLNFGDDTGYNATVTDVLFLGSTIRKLDEGAAIPHRGIAVGEWQNTTTGVRFIGTSYAGGADPKVVFLGAKPKDVEVGRLLSLSVTNPDGSAGAGAAVRITDREGREVYAGVADARGLLARIPLVTTVYRQTGKKPDSIAADGRGPFSIAVTLGASKETLSIAAPTEDQELRVRLR